MWFIKNIKVIIVVLLFLFVGLFIQQRQANVNLKEQLATTQHIASQNIDALKDSTIQLRVTKEQLGKIDTNLKNALNKIDSLGNIKTKIITVTKPIYMGKDVIVSSTLLFDSLKNLYGLKFNSEDVVRTINGSSWFKLDTNGKIITVVPGDTKINDFKLNFSLVISQYDDPITQYTRTKIMPFSVNSDGSLGDPISDSLLKISFRNAEILDKPFTPNKPTGVITEKKNFLKSGWCMSINPIGVGLQSNGKLIITPNISFGYYITLR